MKSPDYLRRLAEERQRLEERLQAALAARNAPPTSEDTSEPAPALSAR